MLRQCCMKFRELFMNVSGGICPFYSAMTIAGVCINFLRARCLTADTIGVTPRMDRAQCRRQSLKALKWLDWVQETGNISLLTSYNGGEKQIGNYFVDGYCEETRTIYEFYGCHWHGCPKCNRETTVHPQRKILMGQIYQETQEREQALREKGYDIVTIWEHEYESKRREDYDFKAHVDEVSLRTPISPRDAFKGGRVNAFKLLHNVEPGQKIYYYDVTSGL